MKKPLEILLTLNIKDLGKSLNNPSRTETDVSVKDFIDQLEKLCIDIFKKNGKNWTNYAEDKADEQDKMLLLDLTNLLYNKVNKLLTKFSEEQEKDLEKKLELIGKIITKKEPEKSKNNIKKALELLSDSICRVKNHCDQDSANNTAFTKLDEYLYQHHLKRTSLLLQDTSNVMTNIIPALAEFGLFLNLAGASNLSKETIENCLNKYPLDKKLGVNFKRIAENISLIENYLDTIDPKFTNDEIKKLKEYLQEGINFFKKSQDISSLINKNNPQNPGKLNTKDSSDVKEGINKALKHPPFKTDDKNLTEILKNDFESMIQQLRIEPQSLNTQEEIDNQLTREELRVKLIENCVRMASEATQHEIAPEKATAYRKKCLEALNDANEKITKNNKKESLFAHLALFLTGVGAIPAMLSLGFRVLTGRYIFFDKTPPRDQRLNKTHDILTRASVMEFKNHLSNIKNQDSVNGYNQDEEKRKLEITKQVLEVFKKHGNVTAQEEVITLFQKSAGFSPRDDYAKNIIKKVLDDRIECLKKARHIEAMEGRWVDNGPWCDTSSQDNERQRTWSEETQEHDDPPTPYEIALTELKTQLDNENKPSPSLS